ncbi:tail assembly chaperone protein [Edwardsiella phage vB_EpM_ZHS]|jgi:hypothetical protein|nr:tail assembly chaperone protein [Edwardsiella phage vB_EpM_ZHS]
MTEVTIAGKKYRVGTLDAMQQLHVGRRIAPLVATLGLSLDLGAIFGGRKLSVEELLPTIGPISHILSAMTDEHVDYIVATCLGVVQREERGGDKQLWAPVTNGAKIMYADIDLLGTCRLVVEVLRANLGDFMKELIDGADSSSSSATQKA